MNAYTNSQTIIFVDIRGFSKTSEENTQFILSSQNFIYDYYESIAQIFNTDFIKYMGDGSMIVSEQDNIVTILDKCFKIREDFKLLLKKYQDNDGLELSFSLGFGIARGKFQKIEKALTNNHVILRDYISPRINLASRLCSFAHPNGIIIHQESFPDKLPQHYSKLFRCEKTQRIDQHI